MKWYFFLPVLCVIPYLCHHKMVSYCLNDDLWNIQKRWGCKLDKIEKFDEGKYIISYHDTIFTYLPS